MARRGLLNAAGMLAVGLVATACGGGSNETTTTPEPSASQSASAGESSTTAESSETTATGSPTGGSQSFGGGVDELRDGVWQIGDAGEVEFALNDRGLSLTAVRPADGWQHRVSDDDQDEIEVHFIQGGNEWKFEVEVDDSTMEISKELKLEQADDGTYQVGSAGDVSFESDGSTVALGDVTTSQGWTVTEQEESSSEIEIDFRNDSGGSAEFEVEANNGGVELEISQKLVGPLPN